MAQDKRRVHNLFNDKPTSISYEDIFLTFFVNPLAGIDKNVILIEFEKPITIALINIYNYIKDPSRGTSEIEIFLDNCLIYSGNLNHPEHNPLSSIIFSPFVK